MLSELQVKNFAIIEDLHLNFQNGLNIISGETGAGKTILLKSLGLLMGAKANSEMIRPGHKQALIEGLFDLTSRPDIIQRLEKIGVVCDDKALVVKRLLSVSGKSKTYLNSSLSTLSDLVYIVSPLVEVANNTTPLIELTSQHESKSLMSKAYHLQILDRYGMSYNKRLQFSEDYSQLLNLELEIAELIQKTNEQAKQLDFLIYQRDEIKQANLKVNEESELESSYNQIRYAKKIQENLNHTADLIWTDEESALSRLQKACHYLKKLEEIDGKYFGEQLQVLEQAIVLVDEFSYQLQNYMQNQNFENLDINYIEERLNEVRKLQKKYGPSIDEILQNLSNIEKQIHAIENFEDILIEKNTSLSQLNTKLLSEAQQLSRTRLNAAKLLASSVNEELEDLNMKGLKFHVEIQSLEKFNKTGLDDVEFMCKHGKNTAPRSLAKTASGGELSRILLALKNVIGASELARTYLFDEVDAGISGETAEKVGKKLQQISRGQQVICITHLPQVASFADVHFYIEKDPNSKTPKMKAKELSAKDRVNEIARLISGEKITKTSLAHAKELIRDTQNAN